jgi:hypothetical protein
VRPAAVRCHCVCVRARPKAPLPLSRPHDRARYLRHSCQRRLRCRRAGGVRPAFGPGPASRQRLAASGPTDRLSLAPSPFGLHPRRQRALPSLRTRPAARAPGGGAPRVPAGLGRARAARLSPAPASVLEDYVEGVHDAGYVAWGVGVGRGAWGRKGWGQPERGRGSQRPRKEIGGKRSRGAGGIAAGGAAGDAGDASRPECGTQHKGTRAARSSAPAAPRRGAIASRRPPSTHATAKRQSHTRAHPGASKGRLSGNPVVKFKGAGF